MKVKILCEFEVESDEGGLTPEVAKSAASSAAWNYLTLIECSGYGTDTQAVTVHVDGFGECRVSLGDDHE